jgi:hypothetical protein
MLGTWFKDRNVAPDGSRGHARNWSTFVAAVASLVGIAGAASLAGPALAVEHVRSPVAVGLCLVTHRKGAHSALFHIRYENSAAIAANLVRVAVDFGPGNHPQSFTETGLFSPGTQIAKEVTLAAHAHQGVPATPTCAVEYVQFIDGTSWTRT